MRAMVIKVMDTAGSRLAREITNMNSLSVKRTALALGASLALLYLGCVFVMLSVPKDVVVKFFNSIMHGVNVEPIMRWDMPWWEAVIGVTETFILGWLLGAVFAVFYNLPRQSGGKSDA